MGVPSISACTWIATLAVDVSFLLFLLFTNVCVNRPASIDALTNTSLAAGVLIGAERIVTQPFVPDVCLISARLDAENANFADGCPADGAPTSLLLALAPASGLIACVDFPQEASASTIAETGPSAPGIHANRQTEPAMGLRARPSRTRSRIFCMGSSRLGELQTGGAALGDAPPAVDARPWAGRPRAPAPMVPAFRCAAHASSETTLQRLTA